MYDYLIVGAGFAGSVIAERLARKFNKRVLICDRRPHIGGNAYDHYNEDGMLVHKYGPHIFHTNSSDVFEYLSQFTKWRAYEHRVLASVDGKLVPIPINLDTVNMLYGLSLTSDQLEDFFSSVAEKKEQIRTSEDVVVGRVGRELYEKMFRGYTRKQWGLDPVRTRRVRHRAHSGAHEPRRPLLHRHVSGDAAARLHAHVREHAGSSEHHHRAEHRLSRHPARNRFRADGLYRVRSTSSSSFASASCPTDRWSSSTRRWTARCSSPRRS